MDKSKLRAIDHYCANWKADPKQFDDCGEAFLVYEKCEAARLTMLEREGRSDDAGIFCEHPTYHFHTQEQSELQNAMRAPQQDSK